MGMAAVEKPLVNAHGISNARDILCPMSCYFTAPSSVAAQIMVSLLLIIR